MDACDSFPCSTSLCSMLCKDSKTLQIPVFYAWSPKAWTLVTTCVLPHPLRSVLYKEAKQCKYQCFGHGRNIHDVIIPPPPTPPPKKHLSKTFKNTPKHRRRKTKNAGRPAWLPPTRYHRCYSELHASGLATCGLGFVVSCCGIA